MAAKSNEALSIASSAIISEPGYLVAETDNPDPIPQSMERPAIRMGLERLSFVPCWICVEIASGALTGAEQSRAFDSRFKGA